MRHFAVRALSRRRAPYTQFATGKRTAFVLVGLATPAALTRFASSGVMATVSECLGAVKAQVDAAASARPPTSLPVRLVAVSKTKPVEALREAYEAGHRHFGENYVQELVEKAPQMPEDVQWHFIGHLQSNKVNALVKGCPALSCIETIDSEKLARAVNRAWSGTVQGRKLRVMVQINSSGEKSKSGVDPSRCTELCRIIASECEALELAGLMTIGAPDYSGCRSEDFETLHRCREEVAQAISVEPESLELSMGMSADYENAIQHGSTSVRVGSSIFGVRQYPPKA